MGTHLLNKLEAWSLILGPLLALIFFMLEPGGMFIDNADASDALGKINAYVANPMLSHVTGLVIPLGLILMLYGISGVNRVIVGQAIRDDSMAAAFSRLGILCLTVGAFGWVIISGIAHILVQTELDSDQAVQVAIAVYKVDSGITILSSAAVATGFMAFNLGLAALFPAGPNRIAALVTAAVSLICLVTLIIGHSSTDEGMLAISRLCYIPWVIWSVALGIRFLSGKSISTTSEA